MVDHSRPTATQYREAFTLAEGFPAAERASAEQKLASWLLQHSAMFDYDNADMRDAVIFVQELLGTKPKELHKVIHASKPKALRQ